MSFIEISDLKRVYKMSKEVSVEALRGVSFEVQKGEFISVIFIDYFICFLCEIFF